MLMMTSRGTTYAITMIIHRAVYYKTTNKGRPIGKNKKMTKEQFEKWARPQKKYAKSFDGESIEWAGSKDL